VRLTPLQQGVAGVDGGRVRGQVCDPNQSILAGSRYDGVDGALLKLIHRVSVVDHLLAEISEVSAVAGSANALELVLSHIDTDDEGLIEGVASDESSQQAGRLVGVGRADLRAVAETEDEIEFGGDTGQVLRTPGFVRLALEQGVERKLEGERGAVRVELARHRRDELLRELTGRERWCCA